MEVVDGSGAVALSGGTLAELSSGGRPRRQCRPGELSRTASPQRVAQAGRRDVSRMYQFGEHRAVSVCPP